jgi:hypothetical protein
MLAAQGTIYKTDTSNLDIELLIQFFREVDLNLKLLQETLSALFLQSSKGYCHMQQLLL